jgi:murein DD-endopeptidase MepM/ murein hydrolase activator NlpD
MSKKQAVIEVLRRSRPDIKNVLDVDLNSAGVFAFDFSEANKELGQIDLMNTVEFNEFVFRRMRDRGASVAVGRYDENRMIYRRSELFSGDSEPRTVHLGIDLFAREGTPVHAPLPGSIHSFRNNDAFGDYGPTIILEHAIQGVTFYTLYGHLSLDSILHLEVGTKVSAGEEIARIGDESINGGWPPHLHFQIITDLGGREGDFPGVASRETRNRFLEICPDPNLILGIQALESDR